MKTFELNQTNLMPILISLQKHDALNIKVVPKFLLDIINSYSDEEVFLDLFKSRELIIRSVIEVYTYLLKENIKQDENKGDIRPVPVSKDIWKSILKPILGARLTQYGYAKILEIMRNKSNGIITKNKYPNGKWTDTGKCSLYSIWKGNQNEKNTSPVLVIFEKEKRINIDNNIINRIPVKFKNTIINAEINFPEAFNEIFKKETERYNIDIKKLKEPTEEKYMSLQKRFDNKLLINLTKLITFIERRYITKGKKSNRFYHSLLSIPSYIRPFVSCNNEKLKYEIDLSNSQLVFLLILFLEQGLPMEEDLEKAICDGTFYSIIRNILNEYTKGSRKIKTIYLVKNDNKKKIRINIHDLYNTEDEYRKCIKILVFSQLLFDFKENGEFPLLIKKSFPIFYESLCELNKMVIALNKKRGLTGENEMKMASVLQSRESDVFLKLKPKYSKSYYFIHDAVVFTDERDVDILYKQIKEKLKDYEIDFNCHFTNIETNKKLELF